MKEAVRIVVLGIMIGIFLVADCVAEKHVACRVSKVFKVEVDYDQTIKDVVGSGTFRQYDPKINSKNFSIIRTGRVKAGMRLIRFDESMRYEQVFREFKRRMVRPANVLELAALLDQHRSFFDQEFVDQIVNQGENFDVNALGSIWYEPNSIYSSVPFFWPLLYYGKDGQQYFGWQLTLTSLELRWIRNWFAVVVWEKKERPELQPKPYSE